METTTNKRFKDLLLRPQSILVIQLTAFIIYCGVVLISYFHSKNTFELRKNQILNDYYIIILNHSLTKLDYLLQKLPIDQSGIYTVISAEGGDIQSCHKQQCVRSNLLEFASIIDKHVPGFIRYRIEINNQLLHCNPQLYNDYELRKIHYINGSNQLNIAVSGDFSYWDGLKTQTIISFLLTVTSSTFFLVLFFLSNKILKKYNKNLYCSYYKSRYERELEKIQVKYEQELVTRESTLIKKIWSLEYNREKDTELNRLFSQEANRLAIEATGGIHLNKDKILPCSIILYPNGARQEKINVKNLIEVFSSMFSYSEDNISVYIISSEQFIEFASKISLYQIIYSIISYLVFMLKDQSPTIKYNLKLNILSKKGNLCLLFEYDGAPLYKQEELIIFSSKFFKKYSNPFLLCPEQIFCMLQANNFNCSVGRSTLNFIKITGSSAVKNLNKNQNNVIRLYNKNE